MHTRRDCGGLDRFRIFAALLVVAIHTAPLAGISEGADFFLCKVLARVAVPFFLMVTGQFVAAGLLAPSARAFARFHKFLQKTILLYVFCTFLYLPISLYAGHYQDSTVSSVLRMFIFDGTFYHLWYFPACILGILLVRLMSLFLGLRGMTALSALLYVIGLFGDSYYGLVQRVPALEAAYGTLFQISSYTRNGIFFTPIFLVLGMWMARLQERETSSAGAFLFHAGGLVFSFAAMTAEAFTLRHFQLQRHDSMYFALLPVLFFLYQCLLYPQTAPQKMLRTAASWIYILHPALIVAVRGAAKPLRLTELLVDNALLHFLAVAMSSMAVGFCISYLQEKEILAVCSGKVRGYREADVWEENQEDFAMQEWSHEEPEPQGLPDKTKEMILPSKRPPDTGNLPRESDCSRAWIELDAAALEHNVTFFRSRIPERCRLMPAVKADAYGHGILPVSRLLSDMGVDAFCVACVSEGIVLRNAGIQGEILILGYTAPEDFHLLALYQLTQTVVDYPYARELDQFGETLHVHIGVDTGMHRLGIRCEDVEEIASVYQMKHLAVDGLFTHLCVSDSPHPEHRAFTASQLRAFYQLADILKEQGCPCGGLHILASYGILNLLWDQTAPDAPKPPSSGRAGLDADQLAADYIRPGIALYGVLSTQHDQNVWEDSLCPVLSLKARVASIRPLHAGESVSYGITYTAVREMRIAAIAIGYADGLPRELSGGKGAVLINGCKAPILGRICMDQCIVDISKIPDVQRGDTAVIIGRSGKEEITVGQIAEQCGTIAHEILTGLAARLGRIIIS